MQVTSVCHLLLAGACILLTTGCNKMVVGLAGMHPYDRDVTPEKVDRLAKRMGVSEQEYLVLSHRYSHHMEAIRHRENEKTWRAMHQPLQLRWYSKGGRAQWIIPNCDVGGFPNLQWRNFGLPDTLFVRPTSRAYADSAWTVVDDFNFMTERSTGQSPVRKQDVDGYLLVYWTYFMGRQSVRLSKYIEKWRKRHGHAIDVRYVNADSLMIGVDKPEIDE